MLDTNLIHTTEDVISFLFQLIKTKILQNSEVKRPLCNEDQKVYFICIYINIYIIK